MRAPPPTRRRGPERCTALLLALTLQACSIAQHRVNELADGLAQSGPEQMLAALQQMEPAARDRSQHLLLSGMLRLLSGDLPGCTRDLETAKHLLAAAQAASVSESVGAGTINETLRAYAGTPAERVLLHEVLALAFLMEGRLDDARVEILQADVLMRVLARGDALDGQVASTRYLGGLVFELLGEWSDAMISYRKAADILRQRGLAIPPALQASLLAISARLGLDGEHTAYRDAFGVHGAMRQQPGGEVIAVYWDGLVSRLQQHLLAVYVPELQQTVSLALPYYPPRAGAPGQIALRSSAGQDGSQVLTDVDALVREDLAARQPLLYATALARMVAKVQAVRAAQRENSYAGLFANMATLLSEVADTRSWNVLPASIQVARVALAAGERTVSAGGRSLEVVPDRSNVLLISALGHRTFSRSF